MELHNFNKPRHKLVPDMEPKYVKGQKIRIESPQHPLDGKIGKITKIFPAQNNCFYTIGIGGKETPTMPERMLKEIE